MNVSSSRAVFASLCAIGFFAILCGAWWETARVSRGDNVPMSRQLRLRLVSAAFWLLIFGTNFYAVVWLWPVGTQRTPQLKEQARHFLFTVGGAFCLLIPALILLLLDLKQTARERQIQSERRQQKFAEVLQSAAQKRQSSTRTSPNDDS